MELVKYTPRIILALLILLTGCSSDNENSRNIFLNTEISCEPPAVIDVEEWGQSGVAKSCKVRDGEFIAWENGYINIRGEYKDGIKSGSWYFYDKNGNVVKTVDYSINHE